MGITPSCLSCAPDTHLAPFEGAISDIYSLKFLLHLRHLERQLATHCNIHKHGLHHIAVHGFIVWCFVIIWPKCRDCFKKLDSSECKQMWIHKRNHSFPCPVLPWQEPVEDIYRASPWSWTLAWVWATYWRKKKKKVSQNGWHLAIFELWYFGWSVEKEVMMGIGGIMLQDNH